MKVSHLHSNHSASRRTHDLRHTCATLLIETGVPLITVKELLGHANIAVTANIYTHTRFPHQADALKQLDTQLDEPQPKTRRRRATDAAPESETNDTNDGTEEPPPGQHQPHIVAVTRSRQTSRQTAEESHEAPPE